jgi:hypothetical protein
MALLSPQRNVLLGQAAGGLVLNFFLNGAAAWIGFPPVASLPLWARGNCVAGDAIGTSFFLPLTTCLVLTPLARRALRRGGLAPIPRAALPGPVRLLPRGVLARGALVGLASALLAAPIALTALTAAGVTGMARAEHVIFKAVYTALLGLVVTPLFGWRVLADGETSK